MNWGRGEGIKSKAERKSYLMMVASLLIVGTIGILRRYIPLSSALLAFFRGLIGSVSLLLFEKAKEGAPV